LRTSSRRSYNVALKCSKRGHLPRMGGAPSISLLHERKSTLIEVLVYSDLWINPGPLPVLSQSLVLYLGERERMMAGRAVALLVCPRGIHPLENQVAIVGRIA
jgi:hypothetical protein